MKKFEKEWEKWKPLDGVKKPFVDIAYVYSSFFWMLGRFSVREEALSLESAAPEMLEALEVVCKELRGGNPGICDTVWVTGSAGQTLLDLCEAVVLEAKGEIL